MREALYAAIAGESDLMIAAQAVNCSEVMDMVVIVEPNKVLLAFEPDIILLSLGNPGADQLETLKTLRKSLPNIPILTLMNNEESGQGQAALAAGANAILSKSAPREKLIRALRSMIPARFEKTEMVQPSSVA